MGKLALVGFLAGSRTGPVAQTASCQKTERTVVDLVLVLYDETHSHSGPNLSHANLANVELVNVNLDQFQVQPTWNMPAW